MQLKSFTILFILSLFAFSTTFAQKNLSEVDLVQGKYFPKPLRQIKYIPNTDSFSFVEDSTLCVFLKDGNKKTAFTIFDLQRNISTDISAIPKYEWKNDSTIEFLFNNHIYCFNADSKKITDSLGLPLKNHFESNKFEQFLYYKDSELLYFNRDTTFCIFKDSNNFHFDQMIYRNEFGYSKATFWSPSEQKLLYILKNDSIIPDYNFINYKDFVPQIQTYKYAFAGGKYETIKIGIYNTKTNKSSFLNLKNADGYYTNPSWNLAEDKIYLQYLNRAQDSCSIDEYDILTGEYIRSLANETHKKYIEPKFPLYFYNNDSCFYYVSRKDGFIHLYSYSFLNNKFTQITKGNWEISNIIEISKQGEIIFTGNSEEKPTEQNIYMYSPNQGIKILNKISGTNIVSSNLKSQMVISRCSGIDNPGIYTLHNTLNGNRTVIFKSPNPFEGFNKPTEEYSYIVSKDSTDGISKLYYRIIYPPNFNKKKKYPLIVDVYSGPHVQKVQNEWPDYSDQQLYILASKGYLIFTIDNRGSANRGMDFESKTFRNLGYYESIDQKQGIDYVCKLPFIDKNRIGIYGWSYGGFMTLTMMTDYPETFKAGIAGSPVVDWNYYEIMYAERYMNKPLENPIGYESSSIYNKINKLKGNLLLIVGGKDDITVPIQSIKLLEQANSKAIPIDFHLYPNQKHGINGYEALHLMNKIVNYFEKNL